MKSNKKIDCIGLIEYRSVAKGMAAADAMLKSSDVDLIFSAVLCPGKYLAMVAGDISSVQEAERTVLRRDGGFILSSVVITDVNPQVFSALSATSRVNRLDTLGVLETMDAISAVSAADKIAKSAHVDLIEIRLARGMGGKGFVFFNGDLANVNEGMQAGTNAIVESGTLIAWSIIPNARAEILL